MLTFDLFKKILESEKSSDEDKLALIGILYRSHSAYDESDEETRALCDFVYSLRSEKLSEKVNTKLHVFCVMTMEDCYYKNGGV